MKKENPERKQRLQDKTWPLAVVLYSVFLGFIVTANGATNWDDKVRLAHTNWLLSMFGLAPETAVPKNYSYAPLWELTLGIMNRFVFSWMHDEVWVRHALTFSLLPIGLAILFHLLRRENISRSGAFLCLGGIVSYVRMVGHATMNVKDFPAAIVYLVCAVGTWHVLMKIREHEFSMRRLAGLGMLTALPFLVRSPLLTLLPLSYVFLFFDVFRRQKEYTLLQALMTFLVPALSAALFIVLVSPSFWWLKSQEIQDATLKFVNYPWGGTVRFFGMDYKSYLLPRWYPLVWIPVGIHLAGLIAFLTGGCLLIAKNRRLPLRRIAWGFRKFGVSLTLVDWLALVTIATWAGVMAVHPTLYDEDRHLLFLMLMLYTVGFLGLDTLADRTKKILTGILILWSLCTFYRWGTYAYIYRSPLITHFYQSYEFMNDYYGLCGAKAGKELWKVEGTSIPVSYNRYVGKIAISNTFQRNNEGFFTQAEGIRKTERSPKKNEAFWYLLVDTRSTDPMRNPAVLGTLDIAKVWEDKLPTGETMCALYYMTPR